MEDYIIEVKNVFKSFKNVEAVKGVSIQVKKGQFLGILGPNGAGKTTLVEMIEGIQKPDRGEILIAGKSWHGNKCRKRFLCLHRFINCPIRVLKK